MRTILLALCASLMLPGFAAAQSYAILPIKFLDTSQEARDQKQDHADRLALMTQVLGQDLGQSGAVHVIAAEQVTQSCKAETVPCLITLAEEAPADVAIFLVVHKSSTLIMQLFVQVVDLKSQKVIYDRNLSFRGDTDESWSKAAGYLGREILKTPPASDG